MFKVGDRVRCAMFGVGTVETALSHPEVEFPVVVRFDDHPGVPRHYTHDGMYGYTAQPIYDIELVQSMGVTTGSVTIFQLGDVATLAGRKGKIVCKDPHEEGKLGRVTWQAIDDKEEEYEFLEDGRFDEKFPEPLLKFVERAKPRVRKQLSLFINVYNFREEYESITAHPTEDTAKILADKDSVAAVAVPAVAFFEVDADKADLCPGTVVT
jgi:hypothetical protein